MLTESINPRVSKTSNGKTMILSQCAIKCATINVLIKIIKNQEAKMQKIVHKNNAILLSKLWKKYKKTLFYRFEEL